MRAWDGEKAEKVMNDPEGRKALRQFIVSGSKSIEVTLSTGETLIISSESPTKDTPRDKAA